MDLQSGSRRKRWEVHGSGGRGDHTPVAEDGKQDNEPRMGGHTNSMGKNRRTNMQPICGSGVYTTHGQSKPKRARHDRKSKGTFKHRKKT